VASTLPEHQPLIDKTFLHVPGVGPATQAYLERLGVSDWKSWFRLRDGLILHRGLKAQLDRIVSSSLEALEARDLPRLAALLGRRELWRLPAAYPDLRLGFFDIETTGLSADCELTVAGVWDGRQEQVFVRGQNLEELPACLDACELLVSYNGLRFDIPFIERTFGRRFQQPHLDLLYPCRRLGLRGGLKAIERRLGISRSDDTEGLDGSDAVALWWRWVDGERAALERLVRYNLEDVRNLQLLLRHVMEGLGCVAGTNG
jgi:uncharacterized protein YprB with RNaseH-like and TPR domain